MQETQETRVRSLVQEDSLEKETATHSSILAWESSWTKEPVRLQSDTTEHTHMLGTVASTRLTPIDF